MKHGQLVWGQRRMQLQIRVEASQGQIMKGHVSRNELASNPAGV